MLTGIKAFEACWTALKQTYPTSKAENTLLVQSMGQFVDRYATQAEIRDTLPEALKTLFDRLVDAYLNGYDPSAIAKPAKILVGVASSHAEGATAKPRMAKPISASFEANTNSTQVTAATLAATTLRQQKPSEMPSISEADTLIVDDIVADIVSLGND